MFGEDYAVHERHRRKKFTVDPFAVDWAIWNEPEYSEADPEDG
jgi:hypothetical protein